MKKNRRNHGKSDVTVKTNRKTEKYVAFSAMSGIKQKLWIVAALGLGLLMSAVCFFEGQLLLHFLETYELNWMSLTEAAFLLISVITMICAFVYAWRLIRAAKMSSLARKAYTKVENAGCFQSDRSETENSTPIYRGLGSSYEKKLQILLALKLEYETSQQRVLEAVCQELNGDLTIRRHIDAIENGRRTVCENYERARETVRLFETQGKPTPERLAILDRYIASSSRLLGQLRQFETELARNKAAAEEKRRLGVSEELQSLADNVHHYAGRPVGGNV